MINKAKLQLQRLGKNLEVRKPAEKVLILGALCAAIVMVWLTFGFDPIRADIEAAETQVNSATRQIAAQRTAFANMQAQSDEDPNQFALERIEVLNRQQELIDSEINSLAGDLVTPNEMTTMLTSVLERQAGLELVSFRNVDATPLTSGVTANVSGNTEGGALQASQLGGQVFSHGLIIEFQGDFFSTLSYLRYLEDLSGNFFWDSLSFRIQQWPTASVTLQIHTLSTDRGFIGV